MKRSYSNPVQRSTLLASLKDPGSASCLFQEGQFRVLNFSKENQEFFWNRNIQNYQKSLRKDLVLVVSHAHLAMLSRSCKRNGRSIHSRLFASCQES